MSRAIKESSQASSKHWLSQAGRGRRSMGYGIQRSVESDRLRSLRSRLTWVTRLGRRKLAWTILLMSQQQNHERQEERIANVSIWNKPHAVR
jgi:hypothetical protein